MNIPEYNEIIEPNDQTEARREHLEKLREIVGNVYPNKFERSKITGEEDTITRIVVFATLVKNQHISKLTEGEKPSDEQREAANAELNQLRVRTAGRLAVPPRVMGKAAFVHLSDGVERLQIYVRKQDAKAINNDTRKIIEQENAAWELFNLLDHGDFIGVEGFLFVTKTGELSVHVETIQFLSKARFPMPDKMHDIADAEISRRYRYIDLIASSLRNKTDEELEEEKRTGVKKLTTREVFERRAKLISGMRRFLDDNGFIEVETPILTPKATGAAAEPFETYHNALDIKLYARIAPELYLKRLMVGGFEKVYELNRNFRNEGLSHKHSPEFTMLEFYCAYMDVNGMMDFAEAMIKESVRKATGGSLQVKYGESEIDFSKFERLTMKQAILKYSGFPMLDEILFESLANLRQLNAALLLTDLGKMEAGTAAGFTSATSDQELLKKSFEQRAEFVKENKNRLWKIAELFSVSEPDKNIAEENGITENEFEFIVRNIISEENDERKKAYIIEKSFEDYAENILGKIIQQTGKTIMKPTFITDYPKSISPLSKASPENPNVAERFELFICGMECANGFSELNDPQEQYERLIDQMKERETGDEEAMVLDEDYIRALSYGMPPAAGIGIGIDRLVMLLTNKHSIRDVILFPHMRPEKKNSTADDAKNAEEI
ncbi:MAG: lysine--tRNA ligase [Acidobacteria bacterium]|nr:lysine--tRNA ligase [Acidobacteriota bacterium]MCA1639613.1 lysine--tRNA ligase [Acidobacteriota bacterium]